MLIRINKRIFSESTLQNRKNKNTLQWHWAVKKKTNKKKQTNLKTGCVSLRHKTTFTAHILALRGMSPFLWYEVISLSLSVQTSSSNSDTPAEEKTSGGLLDSGSPAFNKALRYACVMLGIALCLSLVYECIRCIRARQKVRQEGEKMFATPKTSLPLPFLTRHTTCKPHSSRKALYVLLVTRNSSRNTCTNELCRIGGDSLGRV